MQKILSLLSQFSLKASSSTAYEQVTIPYISMGKSELGFVLFSEGMKSKATASEVWSMRLIFF